MSDQAKTAAALREALAERFGEELDVPETLDGLDELLRMASHVSHRGWSPKPIPESLVKLLSSCALSAPSKSYLQQADIIDVRDPDKRAQIQKIVPEMPWLANAPALLMFCADGRRFKRLFERRAMPFTNDHLDGFFNATVDAAMVMMNFINAAGAVGMGSCAISMIRNQPEELRQILGLPERVVPVAGLCVGYPAQTLSINPRLSLKATFHVDEFAEDDPDLLIGEFDRRYIAARTAIAARTRATGGSRPPQAWSDERANQYANPQRSLWGQFVRAMKFDLS